MVRDITFCWFITAVFGYWWRSKLLMLVLNLQFASPRSCERGESQILICNTGKHQLHGRYTLRQVYFKRKKKGEREKRKKKKAPLILCWWKKVNLHQLLFNLDRWTIKQEPVPNKSHAWEREGETQRARETQWRCVCVSAPRFLLIDFSSLSFPISWYVMLGLWIHV